MELGLALGFFVGIVCGFIVGIHDSDEQYQYERTQHWKWFDKYIKLAESDVRRTP